MAGVTHQVEAVAARFRRVEDEVAPREISTPEDVSAPAPSQAGDESRTITGQSIVVDAGGHMFG